MFSSWIGSSHTPRILRTVLVSVCPEEYSHIKSLLLPRMDTNIASTSLASGRAVLIGSECGCGVHDGPPGCVWKHAKRSMTGPPFLLQLSFTTVPCRATIDEVKNINGFIRYVC